jgi:hypothetical protein
VGSIDGKMGKKKPLQQLLAKGTKDRELEFTLFIFAE